MPTASADSTRSAMACSTRASAGSTSSTLVTSCAITGAKPSVQPRTTWATRSSRSLA